MSQTVEAIYENGTFRPLAPVQGLGEGQRVILVVQGEPTKLSPSEMAEREEGLLRELEAEGLLDQYAWARGTSPGEFKPLEPIGPSLSQTILQDRE
jgi:predicted DNA-binding antitoxin AbrB/MazE fold protein